MRILKTAALIFLITPLSAYAGSVQFFPLASIEPQEGKSAICVLRKKDMLWSANGADVWADENPIGSVASGGYLLWESKPGAVKVRLRKGGVGFIRVSSEIEINVESGKVYFMTAEPTVGPYTLKEISSEEGNSIINQYKAPKYRERKKKKRKGSFL